MRKLLLFGCLVFSLTRGFAQSDGMALRNKLYVIRDHIAQGGTGSLRELAPYLDDTSFVQEFLGYHNYPTNARQLAMRILAENTLFTPTEIPIDTNLSTRKFLSFLDANEVVFDSLSQEYLVTPLSQRITSYRLVAYDGPPYKPGDGLYPLWYYDGVSRLIDRHDPWALVLVAANWYRHRSRFNLYFFDEDIFLGLMKSLTGVEVAVPGERDELTFLYKDDYYGIARLNYLIYWISHYKDYCWNDRYKRFENAVDAVDKKDRVAALFGQLNSKDDTVAMNAFAALAESDTVAVHRLSRDYDYMNDDVNVSLPIFPFRFLPRLSLLTSYCRAHNIAYKPAGWLYDSLMLLRSELPFPRRYRLEEHIIHRLSLDEVTAVEYWGALYEANWDYTYSTGRILDKFYSKRWTELTARAENVGFYFKKFSIFRGIGIIGNCNKYLDKFTNCSDTVLRLVQGIMENAKDPDIIHAARFVLNTYAKPIPRRAVGKIKPVRYGVPNLAATYERLLKQYKKDKKDYALKELLSGISYEQIPLAVELVRPQEVEEYKDKYWFLQEDFRLPLKFRDTVSVYKFLSLYATRTEKQVYDYYLRRSGLPCFDAKGVLSPDRAYEILKYDVADAFVGGGGSRREDGIYLLIKALEYRFHTRLGFGKKFYNTEGIYTGDLPAQALAWMNYLEDNKLVIPDPKEPISISNK